METQYGVQKLLELAQTVHACKAMEILWFMTVQIVPLTRQERTNKKALTSLCKAMEIWSFTNPKQIAQFGVPNPSHIVKKCNY
jgi:hypothetical protein